MTARRTPTLIIFAVLAAVGPACSGKNARNERLQKDWNARCKEAADLLAIPPGTVISRLHRARLLLRKALSPYFEGVVP